MARKALTELQTRALRALVEHYHRHGGAWMNIPVRRIEAGGYLGRVEIGRKTFEQLAVKGFASISKQRYWHARASKTGFALYKQLAREAVERSAESVPATPPDETTRGITPEQEREAYEALDAIEEDRRKAFREALDLLLREGVDAVRGAEDKLRDRLNGYMVHALNSVICELHPGADGLDWTREGDFDG